MGTKMRVVWRFAFEGNPKDHNIVLIHSRFSGKKVIACNQRQVHTTSEVSGRLPRLVAKVAATP